MRALLTGITGQDGYYMAEQLIKAGYDVFALVRNISSARDSCIGLTRVQYKKFNFDVRGAIASEIELIEPDLIFNFASKSSGSEMFDAPIEMDRLNAGFPMDILHAMVSSSRKHQMRFVQASSSEMYGSNANIPQNELSAFRPISPYGAAKLYVHNMIGIYRETYGLHVSSAILFNHESPRRGKAFVTRKIAIAAARISAGLQSRLQLGSVTSRRDWGYAPEYVDAMLRMAQCDQADDYLVATGKMHGLVDVLKFAFEEVGLDYRNYVEIDSAAMRAIDSKGHCGDASKIYKALNWTAKRTLEDIIVEMVRAEKNAIDSPRAAGKVLKGGQDVGLPNRNS